MIESNQTEESKSEIGAKEMDTFMHLFMSIRFFIPLERTKLIMNHSKNCIDFDLKNLNSTFDRLKRKIVEIENVLRYMYALLALASKSLREQNAELNMKFLDFEKNDLFIANERIEILERKFSRLEKRILNDNSMILGQMNFLEYKMTNLNNKLEKREFNKMHDFIENQIQKCIEKSEVREKFDLKNISSFQRQQNKLLINNSNKE